MRCGYECSFGCVEATGVAEGTPGVGAGLATEESKELAGWAGAGVRVIVVMSGQCLFAGGAGGG
jgi:hypothetical protein